MARNKAVEEVEVEEVVAEEVAVEEPAHEDAELLIMIKDDESIRVHPTQTALWIAQGWSVQE